MVLLAMSRGETFGACRCVFGLVKYVIRPYKNPPSRGGEICGSGLPGALTLGRPPFFELLVSYVFKLVSMGFASLVLIFNISF